MNIEGCHKKKTQKHNCISSQQVKEVLICSDSQEVYFNNNVIIDIILRNHIMACWLYSQSLTCLVVCIVCHWLTGQPRVRQNSILRLALSSLWGQSQPFELWNLNLLTVCPHKSYILLIDVSKTQFKTPHNSKMDYIVFVNTLDSENVIKPSYNPLQQTEFCSRVVYSYSYSRTGEKQLGKINRTT